jgi:pyridinium-3,5-biscarboxylic acid mononucleotide sulfurtransferase
MKTLTDIKNSLNKDERERLHKLEAIINSFRKLVVAFSGGVDSTFLLKVSRDILKENVTAVIIRTELHSEKEIHEALLIAEKLSVEYVKIEMNVLEKKKIGNNPRERCYHCKKEIFQRIREYAREQGVENIAEGTNSDDTGAYRPGLKALDELGISSPLRDAGMEKEDIRQISQLLGLETWDKPANPCLATRFPYDTRLTKDALKQVEAAEEFIRALGFKNVRVRSHGDTARIEVDREMIETVAEKKISEKINNKIKEIGFRYATIDLEGFRSGSMDDD